MSVVVKDNWYALTDKNGHTAREVFNVPMKFMHLNQGITMRYDFPLKGVKRVGLTDIVTLTATGRQRHWFRTIIIIYS
ncbi:MAG: hypothetical protein D3911_14280 [Candidatus Electrothrix sp. AW3_4]|nr:hypothetical protein [Candidatus Electrothrix gigas]